MTECTLKNKQNTLAGAKFHCRRKRDQKKSENYLSRGGHLTFQFIIIHDNSRIFKFKFQNIFHFRPPRSLILKRGAKNAARRHNGAIDVAFFWNFPRIFQKNLGPRIFHKLYSPFLFVAEKGGKVGKWRKIEAYFPFIFN